MMNFAGMTIQVVDAQAQRRTTRDVRGPWVRPKVPSKRAGRKGTRRAWKRQNAPHHLMFYREPDDVLVLYGRTIVATPRQADALRRQIPERAEPVSHIPVWGGLMFAPAWQS